MAKAQLQPIISELKGALDNITFANTIAGLSVKTRSFPGSKNSFTPSKSQLEMRQLFGLLPVLWNSISQSDRNSWFALAKKTTVKNAFGNPYHPTAYNLFIANNSNLQMIGQDLISAAPERLAIPSLIDFTIDISSTPSNSITIRFPGITTANNISHLVYSTPGLSAGKIYVHSEYRIISIIPEGYVNLYDVTTGFLNIFSFPKLGQKLFFKIIPIHNLTGFQSHIIKRNSIFTSSPSPTYWTLDHSQLNINSKLQ